ncbi:MAG: metal dependent phosphohydrolase, partial [Clostridia bacterium]|nr:metal dependent phosphohydrolase [Clostridia bacterium]
MITQMISKDVNRKTTIMLTLQTGPLIETNKELNDKILLLNEALEKTRIEFEEKFLSIKNYKIKDGNSYIDFKNSEYKLKPIISSMKDIWEKFNQAVIVFINKDEADKNSKEALIYINSHNEELLNYYDEITEAMVNIQKQNANKYMLIAGFLFGIALIFLIITIFQLYKYIIVPLNELYKGINNIGVLHKNYNSNATQKELTPVINEINEGFAKLNKLIELIEEINSGISFDDILKHIFQSFSSFIPYSHIGIALLKDNGKTLEASYGISEPSLKELPKKLFGIKEQLSRTSLEKLIINGTPRIINDLPEYTKNSNALYNKILLQEGINASISLPLQVNNKPIGVIFFSSKIKNIYIDEHVEFLKTLANSIAIGFNGNIFIEELLYSSILALVKMVEEKDEDTGDHIERMKQYSKAISEFLFEDSIYTDIITIRFIKDIEKFSPMHDIGKVGIKDNILLKPGKLTPEEFDEMKK